jgi:hypothetical protein
MVANMKEIEKTFEAVQKTHELQIDILGENWRPKYPRIFGLPPILKYEAFSSWCARASFKYRISIDHLLGTLGIDMPSFWVDAGKVALNIQKIAGQLMCDTNTLSHLNWQFDSVLADFEFSCLTVEIMNQKPIYKYCPACLASDRIPYFRQSWRLASTYICPLHRLILRDSCHQCNQRIDLSCCSPKSIEQDRSRCLLFCNRCGTSLGESPSNAIAREFLSDVFFRQEQIENLIRSTSSYWIPSQFSLHHKIISYQHPTQKVWSVSNVQVILKSLIECFGEPLNRKKIWNENRLALKNILHLKSYDFPPYTDQSNGIYMALDGPSIFKCISPIVGLQISEYQTPNGSTIWWESTVGDLENFHKIKSEDLNRAISWCMNFRH